jgi:hypothetical protein
MEVLDALEDPDGGDHTDTIGRKSNAQDPDSLAWKFVGVEVVILGTAVAWCHGWNSVHWGCLCFLPNFFIFVVVWAATLDRRCSLWPLRLSVFAAMATMLQGHFSSHFWFVVIPAAGPDGYGIQVLCTLLCLGTIAPLLYKNFLACRRCLQTQHIADGAMLTASLGMTKQLLASAPLLIVFVLAASTGLSGLTASIEERATHAPHCVHTPYDRGNFNTAFHCTQDPAHPFYAPGFENGDHVNGHLFSGIATLRLFLSPTTYFPFHNATVQAATLARSPPVTDDTAVLMVHDFKRFLAVADYEDNTSAFIMTLAQRFVFILTLVASQVLVRRSRSTMGDLLQSRVTKIEIGAVTCTGVNVLLVLAAGSLKGEQLEAGSLLILLFATLGITFVQLACLYKLYQDITTGDHHKFHSARAPRLSTVVPQPPKTAAGATGKALAIEMSPVTPLPSARNGVLAMMEGLKKELRKEIEEQVANLKGEQEVNLHKALEDQKRAAEEQVANLNEEQEVNLHKALEEQKRAAEEKAANLKEEQEANLNKTLEEQKKAAEEKATNLSKAVDEQVASSRKTLEEQRQKIEHLEAQQLHQTETRRVLL